MFPIPRTVKVDLKLFEGDALGIFNDVKPAEESTHSKTLSFCDSIILW